MYDITGEWIVETAYDLDLDELEVFDGLQKFAPLGFRLPAREAVVAWMEASLPDRRCVSRDLDGERPFRSGEMSVLQLVHLSQEMREPLSTVLSRLQRHAALFDLRLPRLDVDAVNAVGITRADLNLISDVVLRSREAINGEVPPLRIAAHAFERKERIRAVIDRLPDLVRTLQVDLQFPSTDELGETGDVVPTAEDLLALSEDLRYRARSQCGEVSALHAIRLAGRLGQSIGSALERLRRFEGLGLRVPLTCSDACAQRIPAWQDIVVLTKHLDGQEPLVSEVTNAHVARAAAVVQESPAVVVERLRDFASLTGATIPTEDPATWA
jgi:hypothetical protein